MPRQIFISLLICGICVIGCKQQEKPNPEIPIVVDEPGSNSVPDNGSVTKELKLTIDTGEPKVTTVKVPFTDKMTVRDLLKAAEPQGITLIYEGEGEGAMLKSLQGVGNQGGGESAKNWIFYVNGKQATVSSAVYSLQPGDAIIWRFEKYE